MLTPRYLVGFTGHRSGFDEKLIRPVLSQVLSELKSQAGKLGGQAELYAGVAEGSDTLCAEIARELGMPVHLLLPLEETEFAKDFSTAKAWQRTEALVTSVQKRPGSDSVHRVPGEATRPECYFNLGIHMLDAVDVLIVLWDGQPGRGLGGTDQVRTQALASGIPMLQIASASGQITRQGETENCFRPDAVISELNQIAESAAISGEKNAATPDKLQECLDSIAKQEAVRFRPSGVRIALLNGAAAMLAACATFEMAGDHPWDKSKWILTLLEMVLVSIALWMRKRLREKHTQERWIRCRFACELVRGMRASIPILDPYHPDISYHDPAWKRFALSAGLMVQEHHVPGDLPCLRDHYINTRLSEAHDDGQIRHYQMMRPAALRWWTLTGVICAWSAALAPVFVFLSLLKKFSNNYWQENGIMWPANHLFASWLMVTFLPIVLPLLAGIAGSLLHVLDAGRRKDLYPQMVTRLRETKAALQGLSTRSTIQARVARSEELLLDEMLSWRNAMTTTGT